MLRLFITLAFLATASECDHPAGREWSASDERGDKPGIGYVLRDDNGRISGEAYIIEADHPHDFAHGRRAEMKIISQSTQEMTVQVQWNRDLKATIRFQFKQAGWPDSIDAAVSELIGAESFDTESYHFVRVK
jgi:hypothetical protein